MSLVKSNESEETLLMCDRDFESREDGAYVEEEKEVITNYEKLFGTPERAALTLRGKCYFCALEKKVCIGNECDEGIIAYLNQEAAE